uniref:Toxin candidate TRINITY_DN21905_c3_g5_i1.p1 n=1 Tax=Ceriantheomorphe brasiliensis TaxID=1048506 RepID=A0A7G7WYW9_9CNID|nr:toxin candidate TRINITY_DN21905_c3_g5_i1.p1 [Ceriantheomorphe brasiliensis]
MFGKLLVSLLLGLLLVSIIESSCPGGWHSWKGKCYRAVKWRNTWFGARGHCKKMGGELVSIHSMAENNFVRGVLSKHSSWIGFYDIKHENHFEWSDGSQADFTHWFEDQPNNYNNGDCTELGFVGNTWNDASCDKLLSYTCKRDQIQKNVKDTDRRAINPLDGKIGLLRGNYRARKDDILKCSTIATLKNYKMFGVQHGGWCDRNNGRSNSRRNWKGEPGTNDVYRLKESNTQE